MNLHTLSELTTQVELTETLLEGFSNRLESILEESKQATSNRETELLEGGKTEKEILQILGALEVRCRRMSHLAKNEINEVKQREIDKEVGSDLSRQG
jgi:hypothetical protein